MHQLFRRISFSAKSAKPVPSTTIGLFLLGSLIALFFAIILILFMGFRIQERFFRQPVAVRTGQLTQDQAAKVGESFCTRLTGSPCQISNVTAVSTAGNNLSLPLQEWQMDGQTRNDLYSIQIDAETKQLLVLQRETQVKVADKKATLSKRERVWYAHHYLKCAGMSLPTGIQPLPTKNDVISFECRARIAGEKSRLILIRIDPKDGSLEFYLNRPYRTQTPPGRNSLKR